MARASRPDSASGPPPDWLHRREAPARRPTEQPATNDAPMNIDPDAVIVALPLTMNPPAPTLLGYHET